MFNQISLSWKKILFILFYSISFGWIIVNQGIFWDDWTLYKIPAEVIQNVFIINGDPLQGCLINAVMSLPGYILIFRILVFILFLLSAVLYNSILKKFTFINKEERFFLVMLFAIAPVNFARITLIVFPYTVCFFIFFLGFLFLQNYFINKKIICRILSLLCFFTSFVTNSLLVFYLVPVIFIIYAEMKNIKNFYNIIKRGIRYLDFILLPIIFFMIKMFFFKPSGIYSQYNMITVHNLIRAPFQFPEAFLNNIISPFGEFLSILPQYFYLPLILFLSLMAILFFITGRERTEKSFLLKNILFILAGIFLFCLGIFPYLAVGDTPSMYNWFSRHQLLMAPGISIIITYAILIIGDALRFKWVKFILLSAVLTVYSAINFKIYYDYNRDWLKQQSILFNLKSSDLARDHTTFILDDKLSAYNTLNRPYRFYENSGLMKQAFNNEKRYAGYTWDPVLIKQLKDYPQYSLRDYIIRKPEYVMTIQEGIDRLNFPEVIRLTALEFFSRKQYEEEITNIIRLDFKKLD